MASAPRLWAHELWRDEAWQWLVVKESHTLRELFDAHARGGGTGYLFAVLCFVARQLSASPRAMQLVQLLMASGAVLVFARFAPFSRRTRALALLGYFPFFEYALLSRSYATELVLLWTACAALTARRPALALGVALFFLCQTTVYGCMLGAAVAAGWLASARPRLPLWEWAVGSAFAAAGALAGVVQMQPAPETRSASQWSFAWNAELARRVLAIPARGFLPVPSQTLAFWNSNFLESMPLAHAAVGAGILALAIALLWRARAAVLVFAVAASATLAFSYLFFFGQARHHGQLWLGFIAAAWVGGLAAPAFVRGSWRERVFHSLLVVHCGVAAFASWMDLRRPFSNGAATAALLRREGLDREPLLGHREPPAATVALYLDQPLYSPSRKRFVTHPDWGPEQRELTDAELRCAARELTAREGRDVVLVMNRALPAWMELDAIAAITGAIVRSEDYFLYRLRHDGLGSTAADAGCK